MTRLWPICEAKVSMRTAGRAPKSECVTDRLEGSEAGKLGVVASAKDSTSEVHAIPERKGGALQERCDAARGGVAAAVPAAKRRIEQLGVESIVRQAAAVGTGRAQRAAMNRAARVPLELMQHAVIAQRQATRAAPQTRGHVRVGIADAGTNAFLSDAEQSRYKRDVNFGRLDAFVGIDRMATELHDNDLARQPIQARELPQHAHDGLVGGEQASVEDVAEARTERALVEREDRQGQGLVRHAVARSRSGGHQILAERLARLDVAAAACGHIPQCGARAVARRVTRSENAWMAGVAGRSQNASTVGSASSAIHCSKLK